MLILLNSSERVVEILAGSYTLRGRMRVWTCVAEIFHIAQPTDGDALHSLLVLVLLAVWERPLQATLALASARRFNSFLSAVA